MIDFSEMLTASSIALMREVVITSETSVNFYEITRLNNSEDIHHTRRRGKNLKPRI
jgi:hypothetical protein